ncbi:hypothetical protein Rhe02_72430 [Rhizocola hellebori]|uniref:GerMN domain-containing protein n=1 Tax=Rhizocola hellebori TaxID=1392758 RepID=A0A8J3VKK7_9ACTN|nr:Gmad2 immunoglobulin-like domain-containing protein [Rhizocola hellebori]GIH09176.1 hypothetical protein Rhe02_72430 [Rhizocola hellebori]
MRRLTAITAALLAVAAAGCGPTGSGSLGAGPTGEPPSPAVSAQTSPSPSAQPSSTPDGTSSTTVTIQTWFARSNRVVPTQRIRPATQATSRLALTELLAGPTSVEAGLGMSNAIPAETTFDVRGIADGVAIVSFSSGFFAGGKDIARLRRAQVVFTLTQFPSVRQVGFLMGGNPTGEPFGRADFADLLPQIVVMSPVIGQRVSSPITISGTADVREATVSVRLLDASGMEIATKFATATCGNGCRGDYSLQLPYSVPKKQPCTDQQGRLQVFQVSGEDGSRISIVEIPLTLVVCG